MSDVYVPDEVKLSFLLPDGREYELRFHGHLELEVRTVLSDHRTRRETWEPILNVKEQVVGVDALLRARRKRLGDPPEFLHVRLLDPLPPPPAPVVCPCPLHAGTWNVLHLLQQYWDMGETSTNDGVLRILQDVATAHPEACDFEGGDVNWDKLV